MVRASYSSSGDYLTLFENNTKNDAEVIYSKSNPNNFYLPKDKGDIGWNVIHFIVGLLGVIGIALFYIV